jgi:hypothetical protein
MWNVELDPTQKPIKGKLRTAEMTWKLASLLDVPNRDWKQYPILTGKPKEDNSQNHRRFQSRLTTLLWTYLLGPA